MLKGCFSQISQITKHKSHLRLIGVSSVSCEVLWHQFSSPGRGDVVLEQLHQAWPQSSPWQELKTTNVNLMILASPHKSGYTNSVSSHSSQGLNQQVQAKWLWTQLHRCTTNQSDEICGMMLRERKRMTASHEESFVLTIFTLFMIYEWFNCHRAKKK